MCGILAGDGTASEGKYRGVAPECKLICGKVLDRKGGGSLKDLLEGLNWILEIKKSYPVRILNISIEMDMENHLKKDELILLHKYLDLLWRENVLVVVAAGNKGPEPMSISPISDGGNCVCVGCHDDGYIGADGKSCSSYSGRGPGKHLDKYTQNSNPLKKPDIVAPGTDIISCNYKVSIIHTSVHHGKGNTGKWHQAYVMKSGTSMAAPLVSGSCALCLQKYPKITNTDLQRLLLHTAKDLGENWSVQGAGMLQVDAMLENVMK